MILNVLVLLFGIAFLIYGIRCKIRFLWVAGTVLILLALISAGIDLRTGGAVADGTDGLINYRLPFALS